MASYTTQVKSICQQYAIEGGITEDAPIDDIVSAARARIFTADYPMYDGGTKSALETKILKHYYMREIGVETVGLWKHFLNSRMAEIMPYYVAYARNMVNDFVPENTINITRVLSEIAEEEGSNTGTRGTVSSDTTTHGRATTRTGGESDSGSGSRTPNITTRDRYSETPQNGISSVDNDTYLTNYRNVTESGTENSTSSNTHTYNNVKDQESGTTGTSGNSTVTDNFADSKTTDRDITETTSGISSMRDFVEIKAKILELITNIDIMIIADLKDLFMQIY